MFLSSPFIIRVSFFLLVVFCQGTQNKKGEMVLLMNLGLVFLIWSSYFGLGPRLSAGFLKGSSSPSDP